MPIFMHPSIERENIHLPLNARHHSSAQISLLFFIIAFSIFLFESTLEEASLLSSLLMILVSAGGFALLLKLQNSLGDPKLQYLGYIWVAKLFLTIAILYVGWMPELQQASSASWGYDPQRYYAEAHDLVINNFVPKNINLNYAGILYYYGVVFYLFGHNPVNPALINTFTTLLATILLVQVAYAINPNQNKNRWIIGLAILLPEIVWYDIMTSRETVMMMTITLALLITAKFFIKYQQINIFEITTFILLLMGIGLIRSTMLIPTICSLVLLFIFNSRTLKHQLSGFLIMGICVGIVAFVPQLSALSGSYEFEIGKSINNALSAGDRTYLQEYDWNENSVGMLLIPNNSVQAVVYFFPRAILYLLSPLPAIGFSSSGLLGGSWANWQNLLVSMSSVINIIFFPYAVASLIYTLRNRKFNSNGLLFHIPYWILFYAIVTGNKIIHERYRVMATLLFWGCIWLGMTDCPKSLIRSVSTKWYSLLASLCIFYFFYKM